MSNDKYSSYSASETKQLGIKIGKSLQPNNIIALIGHLGAGKTTLTQGIAEGLGVKDYVTSPTFIIINEYQSQGSGVKGQEVSQIHFYHIDLYRLDTSAQIEDLGIEEYFDKGGVTIIEWAEKLGDLLPARAKKIEIEIVSENERKICVS